MRGVLVREGGRETQAEREHLFLAFKLSVEEDGEIQQQYQPCALEKQHKSYESQATLTFTQSLTFTSHELPTPSPL